MAALSLIEINPMPSMNGRWLSVVVLAIAACLANAKEPVYYGDWKSNISDSISFTFTLRRDGKIRVAGRNGDETVVAHGDYKITEADNGKYWLDYTVTSVIKNGKPFSLEYFHNIYNYGVIELENGRMIIKSRGSRTPDARLRPKIDGAGVPLVLTKESVSPK